MTPDTLAALLAGHEPATTREARACRTTSAYLAWLPRPLDEHADPVHVTGSAIVLDGAGRTLLHRHKRLGLWLQPGGHVDPGETPAEAALREAWEETGVPVAHPEPGPTLVHVDVHEGGRGHLHLDLRYLLIGKGGAAFDPAAGESTALQWVAVDDVDAWGDASVGDAVRAGARHLRRLTSGRRGPR